MKKYAIIVAGGSGTRMGSTVPKQFLILDDEPIIIKTIRKYQAADPEIELVVVLPENQLQYWEDLKEDFHFLGDIETVAGGQTRSDSVRAGLEMISSEGLVAIHDAVRPHVEIETILDSYHSAEENGSGVAAVPLKDSIREVRSDYTSVARDRADYVLVQTPQTFQVSKIKEAYSKLGAISLSDDAGVFEAAGEQVFLIEGTYSNIKITTPEDLK